MHLMAFHSVSMNSIVAISLMSIAIQALCNPHHHTSSQWSSSTTSSPHMSYQSGQSRPSCSMSTLVYLDISPYTELSEERSQSPSRSARWTWTPRHTRSSVSCRTGQHHGPPSRTSWFRWWWQLPTLWWGSWDHISGWDMCTCIAPWSLLAIYSPHTSDHTWSSVHRHHKSDHATISKLKTCGYSTAYLTELHSFQRTFLMLVSLLHQ